MPSELLQWIDNPERRDWPSEDERRAFERLLEHRVGVAPDSMRYSPYMGLLLHVFYDEAFRPFQRAAELFGMWRDREDMADVAGYVRSIRASRFNDDGTRRRD